MADPAFNIKIDNNQLADVKQLLRNVNNGANRVISRAVNKTLAGVRTDSVRAIRTILPLKYADIARVIKKFTANPSDLRAKVWSRGRPLAAINFPHKVTGTGVYVTLRKNDGRTFFKHAYIQTYRGAENIWRRTKVPYRTGAGRFSARYAKMPKRYRLPVKVLYGPRIQDIWADVMPEVEVKAGDRLTIEIDRSLAFELSKLK